MQSYTEAEQHNAKEAVDMARQHIEADLHAEMRDLRAEIRELKALLPTSPASSR
jgi:voltage-gated sodium channel